MQRFERSSVPEWARSRTTRRNKDKPVKGFKSLLSRVKSLGYPTGSTIIRTSWARCTLVVSIKDAALIAEVMREGKVTARCSLTPEQFEELLFVVDAKLADKILFEDVDDDEDEY